MTCEILNELEKIIYVNIKTVYGNILYYPACGQSAVFASIARTATLTEDVIKKIKQLGYKVQVKHDIPDEL